jgi:NAD+ diphosphatase
MLFMPAFLPKGKESATDWWFVFRGDRLLVRETAAGISIPVYSDVSQIEQPLVNTAFLGTYSGIPCYSGEVDRYSVHPDGMSYRELRPLLGLLAEDIFSIAGRAFQILHWDHTSRFCGRCGSPTELKADERAKKCTECGLVSYPEVTPAMIVAVINGSEILLARSCRFLYGFYSVLAGFVEPGETFEQCVRREVMEEVGIEIGNIRYFASQPWPFPHTLMVGFTADYAGGSITTDNAEIADARWFKADALPAIPHSGSIARRLIDWFTEKSP